jgi:hypothetical protein
MASQGRQPRTHAGSGGGRSVLAALMRVRGERADADGHHGRAREGPRGAKKQRRHQNCGRDSSTLNFPKIGKDLSALYKSALNESFSGWPAFALTFCNCSSWYRTKASFCRNFLHVQADSCQKCAKIRDFSDPDEECRRSSNSGRPHACTPCASPICCAALSWPFPPCRGVALTPSAAAARKAV